jgi:CHRD domain
VKGLRFKIALAAAVVGVLGVAGAGTIALASDGNDRETLTGYEEVPALSTLGVGEFRTSISRSKDEIRWELRFSDLESNATQAHIHFENATNNGPVVVFLCSNLGTGTPGTPACPATGGTVRGEFTAEDVLPAAGQNLAAGDFDAILRAMRAGATYVNVHTTGVPAGEIRAQLD